MRTIAQLLTLFTAFFAADVTASAPRASQHAEQEVWTLAERIAAALPGDKARLQTILPTLAESADEPLASSNPQRIEIAPSLFVEGLSVTTGEGDIATAVAFNLSGSCIPFSSVRKRYPNLLVLNHAANELEWNAIGTQMGDSVIAFWFQGLAFGCMRRVNITPAAETLSRLNLD